MADVESVRPYLPHGLSAALDEPEEGPYADNATFLRDLEALATLQVPLWQWRRVVLARSESVYELVHTPAEHAEGH